MPIIGCKKLNVIYDSEIKALKEINLDLDQEGVSIIGPNGSGKTTLLYALSGIIPNIVHASLEGQVKIETNNYLATKSEDRLAKVSILFQDCDVQLTSLRLRDDLPDLNIVEKLGIKNLLDKAPNVLSMGQKQRAALAIALSKKAPILMLDEPGSTLDPPSQQAMKKLLLELKKEGTQIILFTHRLDYAEILADRFIGLKDGEVYLDCDKMNLTADKINKLFNIEELQGEGKKVSRNGYLIQNTSNYSNRELKTILHADNIAFNYPGQKEGIINALSLDILKGEILGIAGLNGCGKTTLIYLLSGLKRTKKGKVGLAGEDINRLPFKRIAKKIGVVFQNPNHQIFAPSIYEELLFGLRNIKIPKQEAETRIKWAKDFFKFDSLDRDPFTLSYGQRKLLCLASVLIMEPEVIFLDEPELGIDLYFRILFKNMIRQLRIEKGISFVIATHDLNFLKNETDRIGLLEGGRIDLIGPTSAIFPKIEEYFNSQIIDS